jgi:anti-sigma regulatory factor (Ser/Thr protein kinase)
MGPLERLAGCQPTVDDVAWMRVERPSAVGAVRRAAGALAERLGFPPTRVAEVALAVTELGTNLCKHAKQGVLLLRTARMADEAFVEVVAIDSGPGMADMTLTMRDGHSTTGTLGIGLGAVTRMADWSGVVSQPGVGTVLVARFRSARHESADRLDTIVAGITRPIGSEAVCGDSYAVRHDDGRLMLMLCDGAGHGPLAAMASQRAVRTFCDDGPGSPAVMVERIHNAMNGTRGGAVGVAELNPETRTVQFAGVGNIAGAVLADGQKRGMVCLPGIAGHRARSIRAFDYPLPAGAVVVLHSDGLTERWGLDGKGGVLGSDPLLIGAVLLRDAGVRQDDACVLVGRLPER